MPEPDRIAMVECVEALYAHPPRAYHNLLHVESMLAEFEHVRHLAQNPDLVEIAIGFHDCIYQPLRNDNEPRSADVADLLMRDWLADVERESLRSLILATRHDRPGETRDECLIMDLDLAILAADPQVYDAYARGVRHEYAVVDDARYAAGRVEVLKAFLDRNAIFTTPEFRRNREAAARANLRRELDTISV